MVKTNPSTLIPWGGMALWGSLLLSEPPGVVCPEYIECIHCGAFTRNYLVACTYCHELLLVPDPSSSTPSERELNEDANINMSNLLRVSEFTLHVDRYHPTYNHIDWFSAVFIPSIVLNHDVHVPLASPPTVSQLSDDAHWIDSADTGASVDDAWLHWPQASMVELLMDGSSEDEWETQSDDSTLLIGDGLLDPARHLFVHPVQIPEGVQCAVCLEDVSDGLKLVCAHTYHTSCIVPWFSRHDTCPTCRESLNLRYRSLMRATAQSTRGSV